MIDLLFFFKNANASFFPNLEFGLHLAYYVLSYQKFPIRGGQLQLTMPQQYKNLQLLQFYHFPIKIKINFHNKNNSDFVKNSRNVVLTKLDTKQ